MNITKARQSDSKRFESNCNKSLHINSLKCNKVDNKDILSYLTSKKDKNVGAKKIDMVRKHSEDSFSIANFINESKIFKTSEEDESIIIEKSMLFPVEMNETQYEVKTEQFIVNSENL